MTHENTHVTVGPCRRDQHTSEHTATTSSAGSILAGTGFGEDLDHGQVLGAYDDYQLECTTKYGTRRINTSININSKQHTLSIPGCMFLVAQVSEYGSMNIHRCLCCITAR